jgi:hypothetical protein
MMKHFGVVLTTVAIFFVSAGLGVAAEPEPKVIIKMASIAPKGSNLANFFDDIGDRKSVG